MKILVTAIMSALLVASAPAMAASIINNDAEQLVIIVTEDGERSEIEIEPGKTMELCLAGCFVSFPSGGMLALKGEEQVIVEKGEGKISGE